MSIFLQLDDQAFFRDTVTTRFQSGAEGLLPLVGCSHTVDLDRVDYAFKEYQQNISTFAVLLKSSNPDHYKRAGALLHALYRSDVVTGIEFDHEREEIAGGFTRIHYHDGLHTVSMMDFYQEYHNQLLAFDLAYDACATYEERPVLYDFDFVHNVCRYLKSNSSLCLDTCFMFFKALMVSRT